MKRWSRTSDGGLDAEMVFSKIDQILRDLCVNEEITEEQLESELDKVQLMCYDARRRYLKRIQKKSP